MITRLQKLVMHENQDKLRGGYDPATKTRSWIICPPLKPNEQRRPVYFYKTKEDSDKRVKQFDDKFKLLAKKEGRVCYWMCYVGCVCHVYMLCMLSELCLPCICYCMLGLLLVF
ncbi:hypothetical protein EON65_43380 [archaeon]|nr:MAG: hypothetical protein EON65_43380 [archaeon]